MFVASSFSKSVAEGFADGSYDSDDPDGTGKVLFMFKFKRHHCLHVNYIDRSKYPQEKEFLLPPYTALEVEKVTPSTDLAVQPHVIVVKVAFDNQAEPFDLPLAGRI